MGVQGRKNYSLALSVFSYVDSCVTNFILHENGVGSAWQNFVKTGQRTVPRTGTVFCLC